MNFAKIDCHSVMKHICESLDEGLNSEKCKEIKKHLDECEGCQNYFDSVEKTIEFYKQYEIKLPEECHKKLMVYLNLED
ncbi:MAG: hypothetical protein IAE91_06340 [Ignavibacteriaceae bacterium]|nr:hypothetical protein [Ignavibacteriaceae bacterium]